MKKLTFFITLLAFACLCHSFAQSENDQNCETAYQSLQNQAKKYLDNIKFQPRVAYQSIINMSYIVPKLVEICDSPVSEQQLLDSNQDCQSHLELINSASQLILENDYSIAKKHAAEFQQILLNTIANCDSSKISSELEQNGDGSINCVVCDILVTLATNDAVYKKQNISDYLSNHFCKIFPNSLSSTCNSLVKVLGPYIIEGFSKKDNSDVICRKAGACTGKFSQCNIHSQSFPQDSQETQESTPQFVQTILRQIKTKLIGEKSPQENQFTSFNPIQWIKDLINRFADAHQPVVDFDNDGFSTIGPLRGYNWRGKDCDDFQNTIYPGRKIWEGSNPSIDYDCNGIWGVNTVTGKNYEDELCGQSERLGTIVIGDSAGAHFQVPPKYFNVTMWQKNTFDDILERASMEFDLPNFSASSGFENTPLVHSFYERLVEINRCNRGDYQNIGVNGARSGHLSDFQAIRRNQTHDHPMLVIFELIGNDVCSGHKTTDSFTTPEEFKVNIMKAWEYLDTVLPKGSHIVVWGVADGQILYNLLAEREHPLFVKYKYFYDYLNCLEMSPCWGWMNSDPEIRAATSKRAAELNQVYKDIIETVTFNNFDVVYYDVPIQEAINRATADGYQAYEIIEPVDGFHPSQLANYYFSDIIWNKIKQDRPDWIPVKNPNNKIIDQLFGNSTIIALERF
ncbi:surfactant protein B containing protein (macronuclear) [Tetrahymena thermophila SB210]|uniref:Surfactant protein B containing protein n=1 Tax=Tetrahymena thermophila (strain SB210) TaxID=312017 RepID=I7MA17_TETTS|nr:surfactant protein B containing protein [Tetrahymena thermophila SB210]EAS03222.2 surfactant protein B containing protein [Tetrahymena thermophila SB210]|eukprot:XP_001023467.2 surfactant protein B containing protein [Tetrahymena thermophila SB210]